MLKRVYIRWTLVYQTLGIEDVALGVELDKKKNNEKRFVIIFNIY